jgi:hypothetical protein
MGWNCRVGLALTLVMGGAALSGCAMGPVPARQRAGAETELPRDHPDPPAHLAGVPLDGSTGELYGYQDGPDTLCHFSLRLDRPVLSALRLDRAPPMGRCGRMPPWRRSA